MKRNIKWLMGLGAMALVLMVTVSFSPIFSGTAAAYNGPGRTVAQATLGTNQQDITPGYNWRGMADENAVGGMGLGTGPGNGMMNGYGRGGMHGQGGSGVVATGPLSDETKGFLTQAIQDEYQNRALYQAVIDKFGRVLPFTNIVRSESMHVNAVAQLFTNHGLAVPADTFAGKVEAPATLAEAFTAAIQHEKDNSAMYDGFLKTETAPDMVRVFTQLGSASLEMHLKAFEYYQK